MDIRLDNGMFLFILFYLHSSSPVSFAYSFSFYPTNIVSKYMIKLDPLEEVTEINKTYRELGARIESGGVG